MLERFERISHMYGPQTLPGKPRNDVLVHVEGGVEEGEKIIIRWNWPGLPTRRI
jgi:hypothetical protein